MRRQTDRGTQIYVSHDEEGRLEVFDRDNIRSLYFDSGACQSSLHLGDPAALVLSYTSSMLAALMFRPEPKKILLVGLGGGTLARFLLKYRPTAHIECVETRPSVVRLAHQYFHLPVTPNLNIHINDGAAFLHSCGNNEYDVILVDAFDGSGIHPNICAPEFYADCRRALILGGVLTVNLWNTPEWPCQPMLEAIETGFSGQILRLPVEQRANLIALGLDKHLTLQDLKRLRESTQQLADALGLDFTKMLRNLQHHNSTALRHNTSLERDNSSRKVRR